MLQNGDEHAQSGDQRIRDALRTRTPRACVLIVGVVGRACVSANSMRGRLANRGLAGHTSSRFTPTTVAR